MEHLCDFPFLCYCTDFGSYVSFFVSEFVLLKITVFYRFLFLLTQAKQERRKRKKDVDDVEAALLEANPLPEKSNNLRFQADSLHEICLIFFRFCFFFYALVWPVLINKNKYR